MDQRLRQLEQEWLRTGAPTDEIRFLIEALRSRALGWPAIARLSALSRDAAREALLELGVSEPACALLGTLGVTSAPSGDLLELAKRLETHGLHASVRAGLAIATHAADRELAGDPDAQAVLGAVNAWTKSQRKEHAETALHHSTSVVSHPSVQAASGDTEQFESVVWARLAVSNLAYYLAKRVGALRLAPLEGQNQLGGVLAMGASAAQKRWTTDSAAALPLILDKIGPWVLLSVAQPAR